MTTTISKYKTLQYYIDQANVQKEKEWLRVIREEAHYRKKLIEGIISISKYQRFVTESKKSSHQDLVSHLLLEALLGDRLDRQSYIKLSRAWETERPAWQNTLQQERNSRYSIFLSSDEQQKIVRSQMARKAYYLPKALVDVFLTITLFFVRRIAVHMYRWHKYYQLKAAFGIETNTLTTDAVLGKDDFTKLGYNIANSEIEYNYWFDLNYNLLKQKAFLYGTSN